MVPLRLLGSVQDAFVTGLRIAKPGRDGYDVERYLADGSLHGRPSTPGKYFSVLNAEASPNRPKGMRGRRPSLHISETAFLSDLLNRVP